MQEERKLILNMLAEGRIQLAEAELLLDALAATEAVAEPAAPARPSAPHRPTPPPRPYHSQPPPPPTHFGTGPHGQTPFAAATPIPPAYIEAMAELGIDESEDGLWQLYIQRVTPELVTAVQALVGKQYSIDGLAQLGMHGVRPSFLQKLAQLELPDLDIDQIIEFRTHMVTAEFIHEMQPFNLKKLTSKRLVNFRINHVSPKYVAEMQAVLPEVDAEEISHLHLYGINAKTVRQAKEALGEQISAHDVIQWQLHGRYI